MRIRLVPRFFRLFFLILLAVAALAHAGASTPELRKIDALLDSVKSSGVTFIRNGNEYTAKEAHDHLRKKLKSARNSWFAPPEEEWTARMFIEKVASRSSISGKPYRVRLGNGKVVETRAWLSGMLREIESAPAAAPPAR
ncbi:MAG: hypothetical protein K0Q91_849 [Fibrobacteria bacterium]|jgi:hypothetical protein|nr:hypothetical protein [Fibrobacteria bacterium]